MEFDPQSDETRGYHLFLMPKGSMAEELQQTINQLAEEYNGPIFPPHVTLLARIPEDNEEVVLEKTRQLASETAPFTLTLGELQSKDAYFKALYLVACEQEELRALHEKASATFDLQPDPAYEAHLSLLYGNYPEERKAQTRTHLSVPHEPFVVSELHVFRTKGTVEEWMEIEVVPLG